MTAAPWPGRCSRRRRRRSRSRSATSRPPSAAIRMVVRRAAAKLDLRVVVISGPLRGLGVERSSNVGTPMPALWGLTPIRTRGFAPSGTGRRQPAWAFWVAWRPKRAHRQEIRLPGFPALRGTADTTSDDAPQEPPHPGAGREPAADRRRRGRDRDRRQPELEPGRATRAGADPRSGGRADDPRQRVHAPAALPAPRAAGRRDGARRPLAPGRQPARLRGRPDGPRGGGAAPARVPAHARAPRRRAPPNLERRARRPGGGAGPRGTRPSRRGQPVAHRPAAAARGGAGQGAGRARRTSSPRRRRSPTRRWRSS